MYLLLEQLQRADFCSSEPHGCTVGIPCCSDLEQLLLHPDNIHTYRQKAEGLQQYLTCLAQQAQAVNFNRPSRKGSASLLRPIYFQLPVLVTAAEGTTSPQRA